MYCLKMFWPKCLKKQLFFFGREKKKKNHLSSVVTAHGPWTNRSGFSFFIFKKNKISKIYVRFEIFQKYTPVALP